MLSNSSPQKIIYTLTDEAPALASYSLLPIIKTFVQSADIDIETSDISLAARILAVFSEQLSESQQVNNALQELAEQVKLADTNIIKLPNISASIPQLQAAIKELQSQGFSLPDYPEAPENEHEQQIKSRYDRVKGSAVNPILREGNSDRRAPGAVKQYAKNNPHSMGPWHKNSATHVASMQQGDFYGSENSITIDHAGQFKIELYPDRGQPVLLKDFAPYLSAEILDSAVMSKTALRAFLSEQIKDAKEKNVLFSIHLKATMMKVSDPIMFGHALSVFFQPVFRKYQQTFNKLGINANNGLADLLSKINHLPDEQANIIRADIEQCYKIQAPLAMVNSEQGITNLHVPSDIIIDASMPAAIRASGKMWSSEGKLQDTKAVIPDRCYAGIYQQAIDFCKQHGAFDPRTMGSVQNVGLMAQQAEEYGSHDKTFEISRNGVVRVSNEQGECLLEQTVEQGDIWRMCQVKDAAIQDWVKLAVQRAQATHLTTIFWLDEQRAHDREMIAKVKLYLQQYNISDLDIQILSPEAAIQLSMQLIKKGQDCISVTGNVLRDYLTDLFPILELGTSAKMLSIVPLMNGGGLFETGAGGSAPKHVQQFLAENHLRWDSLGEFLALTVSLEHIAQHFNNPSAQVLALSLDQAITQFLQNNRSPSRLLGELDNRGSHFYLALYWAQALAAQSEDQQLQQKFSLLAEQLSQQQTTIINELSNVQGKAVNLNGYYYPDRSTVEQAMRPSQTFNRIIEEHIISL